MIVSPILSKCPSCGGKPESEPYDIGSGPELYCAACDYCWGATGQELDPDDARKVPRELYDSLPDWAKTALIPVDPPLPAGTLTVRTASGSEYRMVDGCITRISEAGGTTNGEWVDRLRKDGQPLKVIRTVLPTVGKPWMMLIQVRDDSIQTWRTTTEVVSVELA